MASIYEFSGKNPLMEAFNAQNDQFAKQDQETARRKAGSALARGDFSGAANPLLENGQLEAGVRVQEIGRTRDREAASAAKAQEQAALEYTDGLVGNLGKVWGQYKDPARVLQAFDMGAGRLTQLGETPEEVAALRQKFEQDPEFTLTALGKAIEQRKVELLKSGDEVLAFDNGKLVNRYRGAQTVNVPEGGALYDIPGTGGMETPAAPTLATPPAQQAPRQPRDLAGGPDLSMVDGLLEQTGGQVTSRTRTAERNAEVGGVGDSYHLTGQARDAIPPRGMSTAQYAATLKQNLPGWDVIDEGDHVHIEPGPAMGARKTPQGPYQVASMGETPRGNTTVSAAPQPPQETNGSPRLLVQRPKAQPQVRTLSPSEVEAAGFLPGTIVQQKPDGSFNTVQSPNNQASPRKAEADLRKEFNLRPEVKEFRDVSTSYNTIKGLFSKAPSAASDIAGIFSYMKMLDPGSVVREGEFATAQNAAGIPDQVRNLYNKSLNGQRLNPKQRQDFLAQAQSIFTTRSTRFNELSDEYRSYASDYGVEPDRVVSAPKPAAAAPVEGAPKAAQRGKDGKFYIADPNKPGSFPEVRKAPDGNWYFRSGSDFYRVRD